MTQMQLDINQPVLILRDKRDPLDIEPHQKRYIVFKIARYEGYFPWAIRFNNGKEWLPGIFDYEEFVSGEMVTINDVPMNTLYSTDKEDDKPFAFPVYRHRFLLGKTKLWEHEIEFQIISSPTQ